MFKQTDRARPRFFTLAAALLLGLFCSLGSIAAADTEGWLNWRGPHQNGTSDETGLISTWQPGGENELWTYPISGRGAPLTAGDRVYSWGYRGTGPDLREYLTCLDLNTGKMIWELGFNDFISDTIYNRYSIGAPVVDPETGNIYLQTTNGLTVGVSPEGKILWEISLMEEYGRLTFPNGRTGAPVIDDETVIVHGITSNWGKDGPARDRFYAFDKHTGELIWSSTPGIQPTDSSFSTPYLDVIGDQRVLYAGTGCGNVICLNTRNGKPLWRFHLSQGGINVSPVVFGDKIIAISGAENVDDSGTGRMAAISKTAYVGKQPDAAGEGVPLTTADEAWHTGLCSFTSSPVLVGDRVYQTDATGELRCVDAATGKLLWSMKLANTQLHASPLHADGKLYVPMENGTFYIVKPGETGGEVLSKVQLEGNCIGSPAVWKGRIFVHTTEKLYCFGKPGPAPKVAVPEFKPTIGPPTELQIVPAEVALAPGEKAPLRVRSLDANGNMVAEIGDAAWEKFIPPTARVRSEMDASVVGNALVAGPNAALSAGAFKATADGLSGAMRGRALSGLPLEEDFNGFDLSVAHEVEQGVKFAYPPLAWIGARFKWEVRELDGDRVFAKTLDRVLFQRSMSFIGPESLSNYTFEGDLRTDGNRRLMSDVGLINQRYLASLKGNWQQLEISSNHERIKESVPFAWKSGAWYRMKLRVDTNDDGSGLIRAKVWPRGESEPDAWTIEVNHAHANLNGAPGIFGFAPQSQKRVYIDNLHVYPNK
jgi:outer membrane protein assembly factor BamB